VQALRSGVEHDPANGPMLAELGELLRRRGEPREALALLQRSVAADAQLPQAWVNYGTVLQELGQPQEAVLAYQKALALQPQLAEVHCNLGSLYKEGRQLELAEQSYRSALALKPQLAQAHSSLGAVLRLQGRFEEAAAACRHAIACDASFADPHDNLGIILKDLGRTDESLAEFRAAIALLLRGGQGRHAPAKAYMDVAVAHRALLAFKQAMDIERVPFFLAYGTLLGIVRDGDLLPHDKDMDVGLAWDVDREQLVHALTRRHGFSLVEADVRGDESAAWNIALLHGETGISIDLFFFKPDGETLLSGIPQRPVPLLWRFSRFGTRDWAYLGGTWQVPDPPERFLVDIYGDGWRVPDAHFDSLISGRNRTPESLGVALCYAYNRLFDRLHRGEWTKAAGYCRQIQAQKHDPFIDDVAAWLAARLATQAPTP
jgi:tetratricopeptide (TPR) repeat protein